MSKDLTLTMTKQELSNELAQIEYRFTVGGCDITQALRRAAEAGFQCGVGETTQALEKKLVEKLVFKLG